MTTTIVADNGTVSGTAGIKQTADNSGILQFQTGSGTAAITINASQALGVGTSPSYGTTGQALTSNGSAAVPSWTTLGAAATATVLGTVYGSMTTSGGSPYLTALGYNAAPSNTGVGNTAVGASALFTNTSGINNTAVGYQAGYSNTTGNITAFGKTAGYSNTTGFNLALGNNSFYSNTTGNGNTAIGSYDGSIQGAMFLNTTGGLNVAVGTGALASNTTASYNTAVGYQASYSNTVAADIVSIGYQAGYSKTGTTGLTVAIGSGALKSNTAGYYHVAVGHSALNAWNYTGSSPYGNTAIGAEAMSAATQTRFSTAVGFRAMNGVVTGDSNVAVGASTLSVLTSGYYNTVVGNSSMSTETTGYGNTALGYGTLNAQNNATYNTAVGYFALYSNSTGEGNVAVGKGALQYNTTGGNNTATGLNALTNNTTGSYNIAVGDYASYSQTTATSNVCIGYTAGRSLTTGSDSVYIGYATGYSTTNSINGNNNVFVGAYCHGSNTNVSAEYLFGWNIAGKGNETFFVSGSSGAYNSANVTTWSTTSDRRIKKNIVDNNVGLEKITAIQVRNFEYRLPEEVDAELKHSDAIKKEGVQLGVIAQELQLVLPECVKTESTGVMSVNADNLTWYLVNAIKELSAKVAVLEAK